MSVKRFCQRPCVVRAVEYAGQEPAFGGTSRDYVEHSTSGILIDCEKGLIITHGSLLAPFFRTNTEALKSLDRDKTIICSEFNVTFEILVQESKKIQSSEGIKGVPSQSYFTELLNCSINDNGHEKVLHNSKGKLVCAFKSQKFQKALQWIMPVEAGWKFHEYNEENRKYVNESESKNSQSYQKEDYEVDQLAQALLPYFVLIGLEENDFICDSETVLLKPASVCSIGDVAEVVATPFGDLSPEVFMNSYSKGVISNLSGEGNALLLTDARCIPGSEGGALYTCDRHGNRSLIGMIVSPLCWKKNEWIGLALACSMAEIYSSLRSVLSSLALTSDLITSPQNSPDRLKTGESNGSPCLSVVVIRSGSTWGSGVLIDEQLGLLLTCSHVVKWGAKPVALVKFASRRKWYRADILYCTPAGKQFDVAVLKIRDKTPEDVKSTALSSGEVTEGKEVQVTGHALFDEDTSETPLVTTGVISKVTQVNQIPVLIQTTCAVHAGASGGVLTDKDGHLLGMVVCNAKDVASGASFPHINLSIPLQTVWPIIDLFKKSKDTAVLTALHISNKEVHKLWNLGIVESTIGNKPVVSSKL